MIYNPESGPREEEGIVEPQVGIPVEPLKAVEGEENKEKYLPPFDKGAPVRERGSEEPFKSNAEYEKALSKNAELELKLDSQRRGIVVKYKELQPEGYSERKTIQNGITGREIIQYREEEERKVREVANAAWEKARKAQEKGEKFSLLKDLEPWEKLAIAWCENYVDFIDEKDSIERRGEKYKDYYKTKDSRQGQ